MKAKKWLVASTLFFLLGNILNLAYVIFEKDKNRLNAYLPVLVFFLVGSCVTWIIAAIREKNGIKKSELGAKQNISLCRDA